MRLLGAGTATGDGGTASTADTGGRWAGRRRALRGAGTVRFRFTVLYTALFVMSAVGLLAVANLVAGQQDTVSAPVSASASGRSDLASAGQRIGQLEAQLAAVEDEHARRLLLGSLTALVVMGGVSVVLGHVAADRVLRPLRAITDTTRQISADELDRRLDHAGPDDEVKALADTIDGLLGRLEASFAAQRLFVANASHELRTPLTTMRAALDVALAKPGPVTPSTAALAKRLRDQLDQIDRLLEGLLLLARAQHGALGRQEPVGLSNLIARALDERRSRIGARRLTVETDLADPGDCRGDPDLIALLIDNIVDNAVVHNLEGGWIRAGVSSRPDAGSFVVAVESTGPVLDAAHVARLGQPFQRLGADRTGSDRGSGLGLSIVAAVADAHGGALDLEARPDGGLRVEVLLPAADRPGRPEHRP